LTHGRGRIALLAFATLLIASGVAAAYLLFVHPGMGATTTTGTQYGGLPVGCVKPPGGYLIIASVAGYNDSIDHGAPENAWPIIRVPNGASVNIVVCNVDHQAHGFQITHYFDSGIETVTPGQVVKVSFVAHQSGTFLIYCSIFCSIHPIMQNGQLIVA
jgi:hypothetical protein